MNDSQKPDQFNFQDLTLHELILRQMQTCDTVKRPAIHHVGIRHDEWCDVFVGRECNCNPDAVLIGSEGDPLMGDRLKAFYARSTERN